MQSTDAMSTKVAITDRFLSALTNLPKQAQKKTMEFVSKFRQNPRSPGINYETIKNAKDKNYRSVRIDHTFRGIIRTPDEGSVYLLLWVDKHEDAYDWACRHKCDVHPDTGTLQIYESLETVVSRPVSVSIDKLQKEINQEASENIKSPMVVQKPLPAEPLFDLSELQLNAIGVPAEMIKIISEIEIEKQLEDLEGKLPTEAFEALYLTAAGTDWAEIEADYINPKPQDIDTTNIDEALSRVGSQRSFWVIENEMELQQMLNAPLDRWRVFLHPTQRRLVNRHWNGPVRVLGGAGTGKTVVAMHRAKWLAQNVTSDNQKIFFTTFTANLAMDIKANLSKICSEQELNRIEVQHIDGWVSRFLKSQKYPHEIVYAQDKRMERLWNLAFGLMSSQFPESFFKEEWQRVILPQRIHSLDEYKSAKRTGRGVPLDRKQRIEIWAIFEEMRAQMHNAGLRAFEDATLDAADILKQRDVRLPYRSIIVDEAQDMGPQALTLLRAMLPEDKNDMFLVGDGHQRIYQRQAVMGRCGIKIVGRSHKLKINYRTTEETRKFASTILEGLSIDDLDGGEDTGNDYLSLTHGSPPILRSFESIEDEANGIVAIIEELIGKGVEPRDMCIAYRTRLLGETYARALSKAGIKSYAIKRAADERRHSGIRLATMHRVKGLEFRYVILAGVSDKYVPLQIAYKYATDPVERRQSLISERALVHVAATRAIHLLYVTWHGKPSTFLTVDS